MRFHIEGRAHQGTIPISQMGPPLRGKHKCCRADTVRAVRNADLCCLRQPFTGGEAHTHNNAVGQFYLCQRFGGTSIHLLEQKCCRGGRHGKYNVVIQLVLPTFEAKTLLPTFPTGLACDARNESINVNISAGFLGELLRQFLEAVAEGGGPGDVDKRKLFAVPP